MYCRMCMPFEIVTLQLPRVGAAHVEGGTSADVCLEAQYGLSAAIYLNPFTPLGSVLWNTVHLSEGEYALRYSDSCYTAPYVFEATVPPNPGLWYADGVTKRWVLMVSHASFVAECTLPLPATY